MTTSAAIFVLVLSYLVTIDAYSQFRTSVAAIKFRLPFRQRVSSLKLSMKLDDSWRIIPDIWESMAKSMPKQRMLIDPVHGDEVELSYGQFNGFVTTLAAALQKLGVKAGNCVSIFAENSYKWLIIDQAIMKAGACNAVRGALAPIEELHYIYTNSKSVGLVVESPNMVQQLFQNSRTLDKSNVKFVVVLFSRGVIGEQVAESADLTGKVKVLTYEELLASAIESEFKPVERDPAAAATLVYTSGTTAKPKGVVLRHKNILYHVQKDSFSTRLNGRYNPRKGDVFLSILPCWHIFERTAEYFFFARGSQMVYSTLRTFKSDMGKWRPHFLVAVPRLFESVHKTIVSNLRQQPPAKRKLISILTAMTQLYLRFHKTWSNLLISARKPGPLDRLVAALGALLLWPVNKIADFVVWRKVRENLGGRIKVMVSGGSALPLHIDSFFDMVGMNLVAGYGLTETAPTLLNRVVERNVLGSVGRPPVGTEVKIVDPDTKEPVLPGLPGVLLARGPGVMSEYMDDPQATAAAIDKDGFFDTGDLARMNPATGDIIITGRAKDTIVLSNGENVAPQPIEDSIVGATALVDQAVLVGHDQSYLSALVVVNMAELAKRGLIASEKASELERAIAVSSSDSTNGVAAKEARRILRAATDALNDPSDSTGKAIQEAILAELEPVSARLKSWERIGQVRVIVDPFSVPNGLMTLTLKIKRPTVATEYKSLIDSIYASKRSK